MLRGFEKAFIEAGCIFEYMNLSDYGLKAVTVMEHIKGIDPDIVIVHHNKQIMSRGFWAEVSKIAYLVWWINDERYPPDPWRLKFKGVIDLYLVCSIDNAIYMRNNDCDAEYLVMGFKRRPVHNYNRDINLCFTGQNCGKFPLSGTREDIVKNTRRMIGDDFCIYGKGWHGLENKSYVSASIYHRVKIGLSIGHYNTNGTYSNRILQIMSHGAMCLCYKTKGLDEIFMDGRLLVFFNSPDEMIAKYKYYMHFEDERNEIAELGRHYVETTFTWTHKGYDIVNMLKERNIL